MDGQSADTFERTPLGDLEYLVKEGVDLVQIGSCVGLTNLICDELGLRRENVRPSDRIAIVDQTLRDVIEFRRKFAIEQAAVLTRKRDAIRSSDILIAAAGELLGLTDDEIFEKLKEDRRNQLSDQWKAITARPHNVGGNRPRELRAALWLATESARNGHRKQNDILHALELAIPQYLKKEDVQKRFRALANSGQKPAPPVIDAPEVDKTGSFTTEQPFLFVGETTPGVLVNDKPSSPQTADSKTPKVYRKRLLIGAALASLLVITSIVILASTNRDLTPTDVLRVTPTSTRTAPTYRFAFQSSPQGAAADRISALLQGANTADMEEVQLDFLEAGAFVAGSSVNIELEALRDGEVTITDVKLVNLKREPIPMHTYVNLEVGAGPTPHTIYFSLDQSDPLAMNLPPYVKREPKPYFQLSRIGVRPDSKETLALNFDAQETASVFDVEVSYEFEGQLYAQVVHRTTNSGLPFRVAPRICNTDQDGLLLGAREGEVAKIRSLQYGNVYRLNRDSPSGVIRLEQKDDKSAGQVCGKGSN